MLFLFAMITSMAMYFGMKGDEPIFIMKEDEIACVGYNGVKLSLHLMQP